MVLQEESKHKEEFSQLLDNRWEQLMEFLIVLRDIQNTNQQVKNSIISRVRELLQFLGGSLELQNLSSKEITRIIKIVEENQLQENWSQVEFLMGEIYTKLQEL